mgnify:CR=1 FL=1
MSADWNVSRFLDKFGVDFFGFQAAIGVVLKFLEFLTGCEVADAAVSSFPVVKHFNVFRDSESCAGSAGESVAVIHFVFQGREERFRDRVVPADPCLSHALRDINCGAVLRET